MILFEEWGWAPIARFMRRVAGLPPIAWLERRIAALPPRVALAVFFLPMLLLFPVKIGALWLIAGGRAMLGAAVFLGAKLLSTGVVARLFVLTQPRLMSVRWFARAYARWLTWKDAVLRRVHASGPWRAMRATTRRRRATRRRR